MRVESGSYSLPNELVEYFKWAATHKQEQLQSKPVPTLPITIQSDFFIYEVHQGPVLKITATPKIGNLIAIA